jgi:Mg/Co/Ni transporter MgtE
MSTHLVTATPDELVKTAAERANRSQLHHVIVVHSSGTLVGMLCGCDMERAAPGDSVRSVMSSRTLFVGPTAKVEEAAGTMERFGVGALPVLGPDGKLLGVVTRSDLWRHSALPNERGVDSCASCGAHHSLRPRGAHDVCFCQACQEAGRAPTDDTILGGEG